MLNVFLVMIGGAIGSGARYGLGRWLNGAWPYGTFAANVLGGLLMGLVMGFILRNPGDSERLRLLLATGVLGGFTTFSSFSTQAVSLTPVCRCYYRYVRLRLACSSCERLPHE